MIPKMIHYCWFGRNPKPKLAQRCIRSWKKYCPDYDIIEWNEDNFSLDSAPLYVQQAYEAKKWAFVTDYVRLKVVYEHGGIYMDTDVELLKKPDFLLEYNAYFGFEGGTYINTGLGFGAVQGCAILKEMMEDYEMIPFVLEDGKYDLTSCPVRNTSVFVSHGLKLDYTKQLLEGNILILPTDWLCPFNDWKGELNRTSNTVSIHWYNASWESEDYQKNKTRAVKENTKKKRMKYFRELKHSIQHFPNRILYFFLGEEKYAALKARLKKEK